MSGSSPSVAPLVRGRDLPLSSSQQRLWFLQSLQPEDSAYNMRVALRLLGTLNVPMLQRSLDAVVQRHEALRTHFPCAAGIPRQRVERRTELPLLLHDLSTGLDPETAALRLLMQESERPFDLAQGPPLRVLLLCVAREEHLLLLVIHHIISDGWSLGIFLRELSALYAAACAGRPSLLPAQRAHYADHAAWQNERIQGGHLAPQLAYWRRHLEGAQTSLELPAVRPRPSTPSSRGAARRLVLPAALEAGLKSLCQTAEVTLFVGLLSAFLVLLQRSAAQDDFLIGTPVAGRLRTESMGVIGCCLNLLVLRCDLSGEPPVRELLRRVRDVLGAALANQEVPFEKLVEELAPPRVRGRSPLVQHVFSFQNPLPPLALGDLRASLLDLPRTTAKFELSLSLGETPEGIAGSWEYSTDLFDAAAIDRMSERLELLLSEMVRDPSQRISSLPLLTERERHVLDRINLTHRPIPDSCAHELIAAQAARTPRAVAVELEDRFLRYSELMERAGQVALRLRGLGVGPEVLVALCIERSLELVVGMLGVLAAGGAYLPLDPDYPAERLRFMLEDSGTTVLLTQEHLKGRIPKSQAAVLCMEHILAEPAMQLMHDAVRPTPDGLAYVIYTSGSTGQPKGVQVTHGALTNLLTSMRGRPGITAEDRLLAVTSLSFDIAALELLLPLCAGAIVRIVRREVALDGAALARLLSSERITVLQATPATFQLLLAMGWAGDPALKVLIGGEAVPPELARRLAARVGSLWNMYGPTETTIWSTCHPIARDVDSDADGCTRSAAVPIGRPIDNTQVYVLGPRQERVPPGVPGELHIGGAGVARGYLGRPDLTAERFIPDPFATGDSAADARIYRTGDRCCFRSDGTLEFLGRLDDQVKLRGFRIEPGEIEAVLTRHPHVSEAAVVVHKDGAGESHLVAYVVGRAACDDPQLAGVLREHLRRFLPDPLIPGLISVLSTLPLTPNGKVDRRALAARPVLHPIADAAEQAPQTPLQARLHDLFCATLGVNQVGIHQDFFQLGGHSLLAAQLVARVQQILGVSVPLRLFFAAPTVAGLAQNLAAPHCGRGASPPPLAADAVLEPEIAPRTGRRPGAARNLLLTGATGFLGAYLLDELCRRTSARITCLIRCRDEAAGLSRLHRNLEDYGLPTEALAARIVVLPGDLSLPGLGLPDERRLRLAEEIDAIYHNGAGVDFVRSYESLRAANVEGTRDILRLAVSGSTKPVHYLSTVAVTPLLVAPVPEDAPLGPPETVTGGYAESKWVAEALVRAASARGVPAVIYRPGRITGDSRTGAWNSQDLVSLLLQACVQIGSAPEVDLSIDLTPVDSVSRSVVALSLDPGSFGRTYHLSNPDLIEVREIWRTLREHGYPLAERTYGEWLADLAAGGGKAALLHTILVGTQPPGSTPLRLRHLDGRRTRDTLAALGIGGLPGSVPGSVRAELLVPYLSALQRQGLLPRPAG